jgi:hypothetical protein
VSDGRAEVEVGLGKRHLLLHLGGERVRFVRREIASDAPVDDRPAIAVSLDGCEVHAVGEVSVVHGQTGADRLEGAASRVVLVWVVSQHCEHRDVGFRGYPFAHGGHVTVASIGGEAVEVRRACSLEWGLPAERVERVVTESVEDHVHDALRAHFAAFTIAANSPASRDAPPTRAPSTSG